MSVITEEVVVTTSVEEPVITTIPSPVDKPKGKAAKKAAAKAKSRKGKAVVKSQTTSLYETVRDWVKRAARNSKRFASRSWKKVRNGLTWLRRKAASAWQWTRRKGKAIRVKSIDLAKKAWSRGKVLVTASWSWLKKFAAGLWDYTAPARNWAATPFRFVFSTAAGLVAMMTIGTKVVLVGTVAAITALALWGGKKRKKAIKKAKAKAKAKKAAKRLKKVELVEVSEGSGVLDSDEPTRVLNDTQREALNVRSTQVRDQGERYADAGNQAQASNYAGRIWLLEKRLNGSMKPVAQLVKEHRAYEEATMGVDHAGKSFVWTQVKRGMEAEDKVAQQLLDKHASVIAEPVN